MSAETIYRINDKLDAARERVANTTEEFKCKAIFGASMTAFFGFIIADGLFF